MTELRSRRLSLARILLIAAVIGVFAVGLYRLADFFASAGDRPKDINIPPAPPPPANVEQAR